MAVGSVVAATGARAPSSALEDAVAETLVEYESVLKGKDGTDWVARSAGRQASDRMWEGWIEFSPLSGPKQPLRSACESRQPNRADLVYWATGLTPVYLEGAFARVSSGPLVRQAPATSQPIFDGPAEATIEVATPPLTPEPTFDPYALYAQGEKILVDQLRALDLHRLRDIAIAYKLVDRPTMDSFTTREQLAAAIAEAVISRASHPPVS